MIRFSPLLVLALSVPAPAAAPRAIVESPTVPGFALSIDPHFRALATLTFPIENLTDAERRIFVELGERHSVRRMIVIQFEKVKPGSDFRFRYPSRPPRQFGAATYRFGTYLYDDQASAAAEPDKEAARTRAFLRTQGFVSPRTYRVARLARVADPRGMSEVIIFYMENSDRQFAPGPLPGADEDGDIPITGAEQEALARRLQRVIGVVKG